MLGPGKMRAGRIAVPLQSAKIGKVVTVQCENHQDRELQKEGR